MLTITAVRKGRTWWGRPTFSVIINDPTGTIAFHDYSRREAESLVWTLGPIVGGRPVGALADILADILAKELLLIEPTQGQEWTARLSKRF